MSCTFEMVYVRLIDAWTWSARAWEDSDRGLLPPILLKCSSPLPPVLTSPSCYLRLYLYFGDVCSTAQHVFWSTHTQFQNIEALLSVIQKRTESNIFGQEEEAETAKQAGGQTA